MSIAKWTLGAALLAWCAVPALAQSPVTTAFNYDLASCPCQTNSEAEQPSDVGEESACGCQTCGCDPCSCGGDLLGCSLGCPWTAHDALSPCSDINYGGWVQVGYNDKQERLSAQPGDLFAMNDYPDHLALHQAWLFVEKVADQCPCSCDWGFRFDILYGTDAQKTQAFGNADNVWDVSLDHGVYGWAMPQLYGEVAYGDWSIIAGHFFAANACYGYEVVPSVGNFFFSHSLTHFNSEPWTHTGVLAAYHGVDCTTVYGGWTLGWDTGFDQFGGGSNFLGGFSAEVADGISVAYVTTAGNFGWRSGDQGGYSHSIVADVALTDCLDYVVQSDYVRTDGSFGDPRFAGTDIGINQYLLYNVSDCLAVGGRLEWWKSNQVTGLCDSFQEITTGVNYRPMANLVIRPEVRWDWTNESAGAGTLGYNQTMFGIDAIVTY